ncbi:MAG: non-hydrolyzing UDP-N-acetylglucosamine 2-epimerase [Burkholderiales bacterium]
MNSMPTVLCVVGARPNFMKIGPVIAALKVKAFNVCLVHTGQHYDAAMNDQHFQALGIPAPDINLEVGSASHAVQTAEVMRRFEPVLDDVGADAVLVVGDVNSTLACALVAAKKRVPVIHVEAGLRSFDRAMPEEVNRVLTDQISDLLFTTERSARDNLLREGIAGERIHFVGNVMIDTLYQSLKKALPAVTTLNRVQAPETFFDGRGYGVLTLHRPSNVDSPQTLRRILEAVARISGEVPIVFPVHPRTAGKIADFNLRGLFLDSPVLFVPPLDYLAMLGLMKEARIVLTDSGGMQEETTALGVPCVTLRENTERPITAIEGTNTVAGSDPKKILDIFDDVIKTGGKAGKVPEYWDGKAATRIAEIMREWFSAEAQRQSA